MKRITINVDIEDNEILEQTVREAVNGYIKQLTRECFHEVVEAELERLVKRECDQINNPSFWQRQEIKSQIQKKVNAFMAEAGVYKDELMDRATAVISRIKTTADQKLSEALDTANTIIGGIDERVDREIRKRVDIAMKNELTKAIMESMVANTQPE